MIKKLLLIVTVALACLLAVLIVDLVRFKTQQNEEVIETGKKTTQDLRIEIDTILRDVMTQAELLREFVVTKNPDAAELERVIKQKALNMDEILGVAVSYEPYAWSETRRLYSPYFDKNKNTLFYLDQLYDYTDSSLATASWYVNVRDGGAQWVEPYYGQAAQALIADYGVPFYFKTGPRKGQLKGTVTMTISLTGFTDIVQSLSLGKTGYGFVISPQGKFLAHPVSDVIGVRSLSDFIDDQARSPLDEAYQALLSGKSGHVSFFDEARDQDSLFFYDKIDSTDWGVGVLFFKQDILGADGELKRRNIRLALTASLIVFLVITIIFNRDFLSVNELWQLSLLATTIMLLNLVFIGFLQHQSNEDKEKRTSPPVSDSTAIANFTHELTQKLPQDQASNIVFTPLGIYFERVAFKDSYNIDMSGKVWMKYDTAKIDEASFGLRFSQTAPFAEASLIEEVYREEKDDVTLVGYDFRITARLDFDYSDYPFDKRHIALEIRPKDINANIVFVPDLASYAFTNPLQKSGISDDIRIPGNRILESYFSYRLPDYKTRFGYDSNEFYASTPSLYFNINVKRILVTSFVTYLIPIFISLVMIFILICSAEKSKDSLAGGGIIQGLAAFFFVLIFSHIDLRKDILTGELVYLEYYYFAAYFIIMISAYNLIVYTRSQLVIFEYKNNIVMKTVYWPLFFLIVLCVTLAKFY